MMSVRSVPAYFFLVLVAASLIWGTVAAVRPEAKPVPAEEPADPETILRIARSVRRADRIGETVAAVLLNRGISRGDVRFENRVEADGIPFPRTDLAVDVPGEVGPMAQAIDAALAGHPGVRVERSPAKTGRSRERLSIRLDGVAVMTVALHPMRVEIPASGKPRIAIVIDDIGYTKTRVRELLKLDSRLTFAVLPYGPYSTELAGEIHRFGSEVILHLPMEPVGHPGGLSREGMLLSSMPGDTIRRTIGAAFERVPHASGVNNHMGSLLTTRSDAMKTVMAEISKRDLFFLDSRTSAETVAYRAARAAGVRAVERDVFLDDVADVGAILEQVERLRSRARTRGAAVAIGHPYAATVRALEIAVPKLIEDGFEIVPVSSLAASADETVASSP